MSPLRKLLFLAAGTALAACSGVQTGPSAATDAAATEMQMPGADGPAGAGGSSGADAMKKIDAGQREGDVRDTGKGDSGAGSSAPDAFFGMSRCQKDGMLLCEDFEGGAASPGTWSWNGSTVTGKVDGVHAARGRSAYHVSLPVAGGSYYGQLATNMSFPVAGQRLYIRLFVFLGENTPNRHIPLLKARGTELAPDGGEWSYAIEMDTFTGTMGDGKMTFNQCWSRNQGYPDCKRGSDTVKLNNVPIGRWACWEWELRGATNELAFSVDEQPLMRMSIPASKGWLAPGRITLEMGLGTAHPESLFPAGYDAWYDEIAISASPIGCTR